MIGQVVSIHDRLGDHTVGVMFFDPPTRGEPLVDSFSAAELEPA